MNTELKDAIIKRVQENCLDFQVVNVVMSDFKQYIYDANGNYLIGGEKVEQFINEFIKLYE